MPEPDWHEPEVKAGLISVLYLPHTRPKSAALNPVPQQGQHESVNIVPILLSGWYESTHY
jgi:hypothetical protein